MASLATAEYFHRFTTAYIGAIPLSSSLLSIFLFSKYIGAIPFLSSLLSIFLFSKYIGAIPLLSSLLSIFLFSKYIGAIPLLSSLLSIFYKFHLTNNNVLRGTKSYRKLVAFCKYVADSLRSETGVMQYTSLLTLF